MRPSSALGAAFVVFLSVLSGGSPAARAGSSVAESVPTLLQHGDKLTPSDLGGASAVGTSISVSSDGLTALVGASGGAWIFTRSGTTWTQVGTNLAPAGSSGKFGTAVALSRDGTTALVGDPGDGGGSAWLFVNGASGWSQQGPKLTGAGESSSATFGSAVALSANGSTALVGGRHDGSDNWLGAAWFFKRSGSTWSPDGGKVVSPDAGALSSFQLFGASVALSGDGSTALIGSPGDGVTFGGDAFVFTRSGSAWLPAPGRLTGTGELAWTTSPSVHWGGGFGDSVALSSDGTTAIVGGDLDNEHTGAAWVFGHTSGGWAAQGGKLTVSGLPNLSFFGQSVALSANGATALIGSQAHGAFLFMRSGSSWSQQGTALVPTGASTPGGTGVALSGPATLALVAAAGGVWRYSTAAAEVTAVTPTSGPAAGGTVVTINGQGLSSATQVTFGGAAAPIVTIDSDIQIEVKAPAGTTGNKVPVVVTNPNGASAAGGPTFTYTGGSSTPTTSTTTPTTTSSTTTTSSRSAGPVARIVRAGVTVSAGVRTFTMRIRVSEPATAKLVIRAPVSQPLILASAVKGGGNTLTEPVPKWVGAGTARLLVVLTDARGKTRRYTTTVSIPR